MDGQVGPSLQIQLIEVTKTLEESCKAPHLRISVCLPRNGSSRPACPHCPVRGCPALPPAFSLSARPRPSLVAVGSPFALCPSTPAPASQSLSPPPHHLPQFLCPATEPRGVRLHFRLPLSFAPPPRPHPAPVPLALTHTPQPCRPEGQTQDPVRGTGWKGLY